MIKINIMKNIPQTHTEEQKLILKFAKEYSLKLEKLKKKQPYHLNIIEELHINENAHSRILAKLLQYKDKDKEDKYVFLESLLEYIKKKTCGINSDFSEIQIKDPIITQEKKRIDLWVRTEKCAIIFENKVYDAKDQDAQISRYIAVNREEEHYNQNAIYVVYLSSVGNEPDERTWLDENGKCLKKEFQKRYINLSFKYDIICWLEESYNLILQPKEKTLKAAIEQYIEYLRGLFMLGKEHQKLTDLIVNRLKLNSMNTNVEKIEKIEETIKALNSLKEGLINKRDGYRQEIIEKWQKETENQFPDLPTNQLVNNGGGFTDVLIELSNNRLHICISDDNDKKGLYVQAELLGKSNNKVCKMTRPSPNIEFFKKWLIDCGESQEAKRWMYCDSYDDAYKLFSRVVKEFKNK